jgi:hypothetical protein
LRSDLVGIPHVQFAIAVDGSAARLSDGDTRVLALQSFIDTYRSLSRRKLSLIQAPPPARWSSDYCRGRYQPDRG